MWFLVPMLNPDDRLHLPVNKELIVGRNEGHVVVEDASVSRKHAVFLVQPNVVRGRKNFTVKIQDMSRFGTFVKGQILKDETRFLKDGDRIVFGDSQGCTFKLSEEKLIVCCSAVGQSARLELETTLSYMGGEMVLDWSPDVTCLVMEKVAITIKVICALIKGLPIVTPEYIFDLERFLSGKKKNAPARDHYQPPVSSESQHLEKVEIDLQARKERRDLFKGDLFIFLSKWRYERMLPPLELGGARCLLWETQEAVREKDLESILTKINTKVFYEEEPNDWTQKIFGLLKKHHLRPIVDAEIGYAVLARSKEEHCNVRKMCDEAEMHMNKRLCRPNSRADDSTQNPFETTVSSAIELDVSTSGERSSQPWRIEAARQTEASTSAGTSHLDLSVSSRRRSPRSAVKEEPPSQPSPRSRPARVLVPQTPPRMDEQESMDVTAVRQVPCSLELKMEAWSPGPDPPPDDGDGDDPFDRIAAPKRRRRGRTPPPKPRSEPVPRAEAEATLCVRAPKEEAVSEAPDPAETTRCVRPVGTKREAREEEMEEAKEAEALPRNCAEVRFVSLLRRGGPPAPNRGSRATPQGPNFKRFKKTRLTTNSSARRPPTLVLNSRSSTERIQEQEQEEEEGVPSQSERNALDCEADRLFEQMRQVPTRRRR